MKKSIELSPRLQMVAEMVPDQARLADVGTDHAYLPASLLLEGKIPAAIAADLRPGPLSRAKQTARDYGLEEKISFCLCDGLKGIDPELVDAVAIAGMGGETISEILAAAPWTQSRQISLILQPMSTMAELRSWLLANGYRILEERLAQEGDTIYTALLVQAGEQSELNPAELWAGPNSRDPLRGKWLDRWIRKVETALAGLSRSGKEEAALRSSRLNEVLEGLLSMKREWMSWQ